MKLKKTTALLLAVITLLSTLSVFSFAAFVEVYDSPEASAMSKEFVYDVGPETDGLSVDYHYFSPVKEKDTTKYPLVIWLHGMGDGSSPGKQISTSNVAAWASENYQSRFKGVGGAFIIAPRCDDAKETWGDKYISVLRATIDDFIAENRDNIDVSRIYIGGYSMGGKMTLKMLVAYPEMFAAAFPICPAWVPSEEATACFKDVPIWMTSGAQDPLVNYYAFAMTTWSNIISQSNVAEICRLSILKKTCYPDGEKAYSAHLAWFSVNNDMFSSDNGDYPKMKTVDGNGDTVTLQYPDGMISWISAFESDYDGSPATDKGNDEAYTGFDMNIFSFIKAWITNYIVYLKSLWK